MSWDEPQVQGGRDLMHNKVRVTFQYVATVLTRVLSVIQTLRCLGYLKRLN